MHYYIIIIIIINININIIVIIITYVDLCSPRDVWSRGSPLRPRLEEPHRHRSRGCGRGLQGERR